MRRKSSRRVKKTASANAWRFVVRGGNLFVAENRFKKHLERDNHDGDNRQTRQQFRPTVSMFGWLWFCLFQDNRFHGRGVPGVLRGNTDRIKFPNDANRHFVFSYKNGIIWRGDKRRVNRDSFGVHRVPFQHDFFDDDWVRFFE